MSIDQYPGQPVKQALNLVSDRILIPHPGDLARIEIMTELPGGAGAYIRLMDAGSGVESLRIGSSTAGVGFSLIDLNSDGTIRVDGQLLAHWGSAAAPSYSFTGDSNTGIYRLSENVIAFSAGGVHQFQTGYASRPGLHLISSTDWTKPPLAFADDTDTGLLRGTSSGLDTLFLIAGGDYTLAARSDGAMLYPRHPTIANAANVHMSTSGWIYRSTSSGDIKRDVETLGESVIDSLRPVTFKAKPEHVPEGEDPDKEFVGFVAEEVAEADPRLAQRDEDGKVVYFDVNGLMAHLVAEVQSLRERVAELEPLQDRVASLEAKVDRLLSAQE